MCERQLKSNSGIYFKSFHTVQGIEKESLDVSNREIFSLFLFRLKIFFFFSFPLDSPDSRFVHLPVSAYLGAVPSTRV